MTRSERQRIVRVPGSRRAQLTPVPEATEEPVSADMRKDAAAEPAPDQGPNDEQLRRDVPPHY